MYVIFFVINVTFIPGFARVFFGFYEYRKNRVILEKKKCILILTNSGKVCKFRVGIMMMYSI